jgi:hypothetical protein
MLPVPDGDILVEAFEWNKNSLQRLIITRNGKKFKIPCLSG